MQLLDNLMWMRNRTYSPEVKVPRLMFYHVPKTGGQYLFTSLSCALLIQSKLATAVNPSFPGFESHRIDTPDVRDRINSLWLVGTHLPYGWHVAYPTTPPFQLFTLLRDPFDRVLSDYTYNCMRNAKRPSLEEFRDFAALPEHCNAMVRHFCNGDPDAAQAIAILQRDFLAYDTNAHIPEMLEGLLTYANLPNVMIGGRINYTFDEYRLDASALRPQFEALNRADMEFYDEVQSRPRRLPLPEGQNHHPATVLLRETGGTDGSLTRMQAVGTAQLLEVIAQCKTGEEVFSALFK